jgi:membrane protein DedA with SNARE-associated domain
MTATSVGLGYLVGLFGVIVSGAVLPFVPTGGAVSVAAALAEQDHLLLIVLVVAFGAAGAYVADLATYAAFRLAEHRADRGTGHLTRWLHRQRHGKTLERVQQQLTEHELRTLLLSRLVPGGQLPVLVAAAIGGYPWRRYAIADIGAVTLWSTMYAASGLAGRAVFPKAWEGAVAGIALVLLISLFGQLWTRRHHPVRATSEASPRIGPP